MFLLKINYVQVVMNIGTYSYSLSIYKFYKLIIKKLNIYFILFNKNYYVL